jgi:hypothetical protein
MALKSRVGTLSLGSPSVPVVYPKQDAPAGQHIRVAFMPNRVQRPGVGSDSTHVRPGILQLSLMTPVADQDASEVDLELAGQIAQHFPADLTLSFAGTQVRVTRAPDVAAAFRDDAWWMTPVSVRWESYK